MQRGVPDRKKASQKASRWVLCPPQAFSFPERVKKLLLDLVVPFYTLLMQALEQDLYRWDVEELEDALFSKTRKSFPASGKSPLSQRGP